MSKIKLTQGYKAIVDPVDFNNLSQFKWHIFKSRNLLYAARTLDKKNSFLHHEIAKSMGLEASDDQVIGFINGDGLDCRRDNLYLRDKAIRLNGHTAYKNKIGKSGYRGVSAISSGNYRSQFAGKVLGTYASPIEAAIAYDKAAIDRYGDKAILNFGL